MLDYVRTELDTFDGRGFCTVDSLVLSWLAYTRLPADDPALAPALGWEGVRLADLYRAEYFATYYAGMWGEEPGLDLLAAVAASPRFRDVRVMSYVDATDPQAEKQFAAMTFRLTEDLSYVAFRGTDASLVGWHGLEVVGADLLTIGLSLELVKQVPCLRWRFDSNVNKCLITTQLNSNTIIEYPAC